MEEKYTDPTYDWSFKRIFLSHDSKDMLKLFINDVLEGELVVESVEDVVIPPRDNMEDKTSYFDIHCKDQSGQMFIVEMQRNPEANFLKRLGYYWGRAYTRKLKYTDSYAKLCHVTLVVICDFPIMKSLIEEQTRYVERFCLFGSMSGQRMKGIPAFFSVLDLPAYRKMGFPHQAALDEWLDIFTCTDRKEKDPQVRLERKHLKEALERLAFDKLSQAEKDLLEAEADIRRRAQDVMEQALEDSRKQGEEIGKREERRALIAQMIRSGMSKENLAQGLGISLDEIETFLKSP
jgi:predicted transposase/invertase (TIGR01784 family)